MNTGNNMENIGASIHVTPSDKVESNLSTEERVNMAKEALKGLKLTHVEIRNIADEMEEGTAGHA